jgi:hypothetical protein
MKLTGGGERRSAAVACALPDRSSTMRIASDPFQDHQLAEAMTNKICHRLASCAPARSL